MKYRLRKDSQRPYIHVSEGIVDDASTEFQKLTGYSSHEILGRPIRELCKLIRIDAVEFLTKSDKAERSSCFIFTKDFEPREVEIWSKSEGDKTALYYFREKPDSRMYENLRLFKQTFEQGKMMTALLSFPDLIILDANQYYLKHWDEPYNRKEASIGMKYTDLISEDFRNNIFDGIILKEISEGRPFFRYDVEYCHPGKRTTFWDMSYMPVYNGNEMKYIVLQCIDVTEKVLEKAKIERQQEEFYANISHELKTPLNVIFSTNQLIAHYLKNGLLEDNTDKMLNSTNTITQNCYRLTRLISNLTDLSKIRAGYLKLNTSKENIVSLVEDTVESIADYVKYNKLKIVFDTDTEEKIISCDPERIDRIILNLISNSVKFTKAGGNIFVTVADKGDSVEISVKDNGIGIEEENLRNIFDRFYQGDSSLICNKGGSGIGLHLAKTIVELHGGKMSVESRAGEGCEFKIEIPANL